MKHEKTDIKNVFQSFSIFCKSNGSVSASDLWSSGWGVNSGSPSLGINSASSCLGINSASSFLGINSAQGSSKVDGCTYKEMSSL